MKAYPLIVESSPVANGEKGWRVVIDNYGDDVYVNYGDDVYVIVADYDTEDEARAAAVLLASQLPDAVSCHDVGGTG